MLTAVEYLGSAATSQSKAVIVRKVGVTRLDCRSIAILPLAKRDSTSSASISSSVG